MGIWIVWLIVAAVLGVAELVTMTLALGLIAVGAVAAAGVGAAGGNGALQFGAFIAASRVCGNASAIGKTRSMAAR